jgi:hypothetical protein
MWLHEIYGSVVTFWAEVTGVYVGAKTKLVILPWF